MISSTKGANALGFTIARYLWELMPTDPKDRNETADANPPSSLPVEDRLRLLERDVRNLYIALERNTAAVETLYAETRKLGLWLDSTAKSTQEITQSRIWRTLIGIGGLFLSLPLFRRGAPATILPTEPEDPGSEYQRWIGEFESRDDAAIRLRLANFTNRPHISIVIPCFRVGTEALKRTVASVFAQSCSYWELCVAGDGSEKALQFDPRIRTKSLPASSGEAAVWSATMELASATTPCCWNPAACWLRMPCIMSSNC